MADFYGALESTAFRVRDDSAFLAEPAVIHARTQDGFFEQEDGYWAFGWDAQYPSPVFTDEEDIEHDLCDAIQRHIIDGDVCRVQISGQEKLRYIGGDIWFVTSKGISSFPGVTDWHDRLTSDTLQEIAMKFADDVESVC